MTARFIVTGTDTGVGKTVFAAGLAHLLGAAYWKPIQAGLVGETDSDTVRRLAGLPPGSCFPEAYRLAMPASPHIAADREGVIIDADRLVPPATDRSLVIEGAGGLMVPLDDGRLFIDTFARWRIPVILVARTQLGTINHSLLSLEAMRRRDIAVHGIAFVGAPEPAAEDTIVRLGDVRRLGRLPWLDPCEPGSLRREFEASFRPESFVP